MQANVDARTVEGFGEEWSRFDQTGLRDTELRQLFDGYFRIFPWEILPKDAVGFDMGCGSGRWASLVAPRIGKLICVDASANALEVAKRNLADHPNCEFYCASVAEFPIGDASADFGYSLGVLHHIPDPQEGINHCARKLKRGAPFLIYLYYAFDNRSAWFRRLWRVSEIFRRAISGLPTGLRHFSADVIAALVYFPTARTARLIEKMGVNVDSFPLSIYRDKSFYTMRTDALDRFGTPLEFRFTRAEIEKMLNTAGIGNVKFSDQTPYWCAVGIKQ